MTPVEIARIHKTHWRVGFGSVTAEEVEHFQEVISEHRPKTFIEVGTATGLSGGMIALVMEEHGGQRFVTIDHDNTFFGDTSKENGFLIPAIYPEGRPVEVVRRPFTIAADLPGAGESFEMGFVDANHQHPWPTLDALCLYPVMTGPKIVFNHDLDLYRKQRDKIFGIGPKYLYDQFPESHRRRFTANQGNLFLITLDLPREEMERIAMQSLALPWSLRGKMGPKQLRKVRQVLDDFYSPELREVFDECVDKFNKPI